MKAPRRAAIAILAGLSLSLALTGSASAQDVPTGAARLIEKVQARVFISQSSIENDLAVIVANAQEALANK